MPTRLGLGIIGLGRRWRRWRPALAAVAGEAAVRAVCDPSAARAERAARLLRGQQTLRGEQVCPLWSGAALALLHGVAELFGGPPLRIGAQAAEGAGFVSLLLWFGAGRVAQLSLWRGARAGWRLEVMAAHG